MTYVEGQLVYTSKWGVARVARHIDGGTYILLWYGVGKGDDDRPRLHHELTTEDTILGAYYVPEELEAVGVLMAGRKP